jgi:thiol-disulfide isomerase/thioredoxin
MMEEYVEKDRELRGKLRERMRDVSEEERAETLRRFLEEEVKPAIAKYSNSFWGPVLIYSWSGNIKPYEAQYTALSTSAKNSFLGRSLRTYLDSYITQAVPFTAKDVDGKEHTLESLMKGNKYLILDFWASWCAPCRRAIPKMKELSEKYASEGLALVFISIDRDREAWVKALEQEQMPWINLHDEDGSARAAYGVRGIPSVFLIEANGKVHFAKLYGDAIVHELEKVFGF